MPSFARCGRAEFAENPAEGGVEKRGRILQAAAQQMIAGNPQHLDARTFDPTRRSDPVCPAGTGQDFQDLIRRAGGQVMVTEQRYFPDDPGNHDLVLPRVRAEGIVREPEIQRPAQRLVDGSGGEAMCLRQDESAFQMRRSARGKRQSERRGEVRPGPVGCRLAAWANAVADADLEGGAGSNEARNRCLIVSWITP